MTQEILIGIDLGTTVLKIAAIAGGTGEVLASAEHRLKVKTEEGGIREQEPSELIRALDVCLKEVQETLGERRWKSVSGIGLAAQGGSTIVADRKTGEPLTPMILWNDSRAYPYLPEIQAMRSLRSWRKHTARDEPGAGLARLLWLREIHPEILNESNIYVGAGEFLFFHLTGKWRQDAGNALQIGCFSVEKEDLLPELLKGLGVPVDFFAPMRDGHETSVLDETAAKAYRLPVGIPVAGPYMDHEAGYLASVGDSHSPLQFSLGTAWVGNFVLPKEYRGGSPYQLVLPSPVANGKLVVQPLLTGNVTWDWGLETLLDRNHRSALAKLARVFEERLLPPEGLLFLPWLARPNPLDETLFGGGAFIGVEPETGPKEMLRALAAGMCCELRRVFDRVNSMGCVDRAILGGGAAQGSFFRILIAALFDPLPIYAVSEGDPVGPRGTLYVFSKAAARAKTERVMVPDEAVSTNVRRIYSLYQEAYKRLYGHVPAGGHYEIRRKKGS